MINIDTKHASEKRYWGAHRLEVTMCSEGSATGRPAISTEVFLILFYLKANAETVPKIPSCYCVLFTQPSRFTLFFINLLKPTRHVMHQQFNIQQLYALPTLYLCVLYLSENNSDLCHLQHKLIGFYNRDGKCLLRGTNWVFK